MSGTQHTIRNRLRTYITVNINEIAASQTLLIYGAFLAATHVSSAIFMFNDSPLIRTILERKTPSATSFCWSYFSACHLVTVPGWLFDFSGYLYLISAVVVAALFIARRSTAGYWGLVALTLYKLAWFSLDYRHMGNYHYMPFIVSAIYFLIPQKVLVTRCMVILFYLTASALKLNNDWLSGGALYGSPAVSGMLLEWMCAYVVVLEMLIVFGLVAQTRWIRWAAFAQFVIFHLYSYRIVGYFYPSVMLCILAIFPLNWLLDKQEVVWPFRNLRRPGLIAIIIYVLLQLIPHLQPGDPALRGEGRFFALNLFDSNTACVPQFFLKQNGTITEIRPATDMASRIHCDPLIIWNYAREQCRKNEGSPGFDDLDITFSSRRLSHAASTPLIAFENFCRKNPGFNVLLPNGWML